MKIKMIIIAILIILVVICISFKLWLWYGFSLTDKDLPQKMSDKSLSTKYQENKELLSEFIERFLQEPNIYDIRIDKQNQVRINNYKKVSIRNITQNSIPVGTKNIKFYWNGLKELDFIGVTAGLGQSNEKTYVQFFGAGSFEVSYGLFYSPKDIDPPKLKRSVYYYKKISDNWYTYRAE